MQNLHNIYTTFTQHLHNFYTTFTQHLHYLHKIYILFTQHLHNISTTEHLNDICFDIDINIDIDNSNTNASTVSFTHTCLFIVGHILCTSFLCSLELGNYGHLTILNQKKLAVNESGTNLQ